MSQHQYNDVTPRAARKILCVYTRETIAPHHHKFFPISRALKSALKQLIIFEDICIHATKEKKEAVANTRPQWQASQVLFTHSFLNVFPCCINAHTIHPKLYANEYETVWCFFPFYVIYWIFKTRSASWRGNYCYSIDGLKCDTKIFV